MNRTRISRLLSLTALAVIGVLFSSSVIWAQTAPPADTLKVNYFSNANLGYPSATVYVSDPGTNAPANICAMIYVVDPAQELRECCGCMITPDGLLTLSVDWDLTRNSNTPGALNNGTIKIVSSTGSPTCNPSKPVPTATVRAWGTHIQTNGVLTESEALDAPLSTNEVTKLGALCGSIMRNSSGYGVCTCGTNQN
jgi:hypothetical protein